MSLTLQRIVQRFAPQWNKAAYPLLLKGTPLAACIEEEIASSLRKYIDKGARQPQVAIVLASKNPASQTYVKRKIQACARIGFKSLLFNEEPSEAAITQRVKELAADDTVDGIMVQLPVPGINVSPILESIPWQKDVDGLTGRSISNLAHEGATLIPCTPLGIFVTLRAYKVELTGQHVVILGKSNEVGEPLAILLSDYNKATVTVIDIATNHEVSAAIRETAAVQVAATGTPRKFKICREGAVAVDVGINHIVDAETGKRRIVGDFDLDAMKHRLSAYTPVPGGVGPMTVSMLMLNTFLAYESHMNKVDLKELTEHFLSGHATLDNVAPYKTFKTKILLVSSGYNGMTQLVHQTLLFKGYQVAFHEATTEEAMYDAFLEQKPDLVIAPMLKTKIPEKLYKEVDTMIVHPGVPGDRGPSSIDWAIMENKAIWGVTVVEASEVMDGGNIWASKEFDILRKDVTKSGFYNGYSSRAGCQAVMKALERWHYKERPTEPVNHEARARGTLKPTMKQIDRKVHWETDNSDAVIRKIRASDGFPGVLTEFFGEKFYMYDAHPETRLSQQIDEKPGKIIGVRDMAVCVKTRDSAVWLGHLRKSGKDNFKLPATISLGSDLVCEMPRFPISFRKKADQATYQDCYYEEHGQVGSVVFDFYNGAMRPDQCRRLQQCIEYAKLRPTRVIVLRNRAHVWSNGINLNTIEAAEDPQAEAWECINCIDDVVKSILTATDHVTISQMGGNAGAGGVPFARASDIVVCPEDSVLNPHYKKMGLFGSEYWTYVLPLHLGWNLAMQIVNALQPTTAQLGLGMGLVNFAVPMHEIQPFVRQLSIEQAKQAPERCAFKKERFQRQEKEDPLDAMRLRELDMMKRNIFDDIWGFAEKRYKFVHKLK